MSTDDLQHAETEAGDEKVAETRKKRLSDEAQYAEDLRQIMATPAGRRVMRRLIERAGCFRLSYAGESTHATSFNEGKRDQGNRLFAELEQAAPNEWLLMLRESKQPKKSP